MLKTKAKNALLTLACGDAYGNVYEMEGLMGARFDKANLPNEAEIKNYTDDTKMAMILWLHYSEYGTIVEDILFKAYAKWAREDGYADGIGIHTAGVLLKGKSDKSSQGNGVLMRVLPFGLRLIEEGMAFENAVALVNRDAALTHDNDVIRMTNRFCLDIAVNGMSILEKPEYQALLSTLRQGHSAWVIYTLHDVLEVLKMDLSILDGFKELVSRGGDTDTSCAIYGAIRGYREELELDLDDYLDKASQMILQTFEKMTTESTKGRKLLNESEELAKYYSHSAMVRRRKILRETLNVFTSIKPTDYIQKKALENLRRWKDERTIADPEQKVQVIQGDWGDVTLALTKKYGTIFAVLNMANAYVPGGGYVEGMSAQEENMYRRTDCHFYIDKYEYDRSKNQYHLEMTALIKGKHGKVYLDTENPRICIRGSEDKTKENLGYRWLPEEDIFPFYELRAAAQYLREDKSFAIDEARRRIVAQLDTLREKGVMYAVLGAFGCGAFLNPPETIAKLYKEEIDKRIDDFSLIVFAILDAGKVYTDFNNVFKNTE